MRARELSKITLRLLLISLTYLYLIGCSTVRPESLGSGFDLNGTRLYLAVNDAQRERLNGFIQAHSDITEESKIQYLLSCVDLSHYGFIRNGSKYTGTQAMQWLRWKRTHHQYRNCPILTANDFVNRVADGSKASGRPYEVILPDGRRQNLQSMLGNELLSLEAALHVQALHQALSENSPAQEKAGAEPNYAPIGVQHA
jgi:hypothetical protein